MLFIMIISMAAAGHSLRPGGPFTQGSGAAIVATTIKVRNSIAKRHNRFPILTEMIRVTDFTITDGRLAPARWCPSPNFGPRPTDDAGDITLLVIHNISLPPGQYGGGYVEAFFQNRLPVADHPYFAEIAALQVSSHLFINRQGEVVQFVNLNDRAWHAGASCHSGRDNCNDYSVGIELEGTDTDAYTDAQYRTLIDVSEALLAAYPDLHRGRITGHEHIAPGRKTDPGIAFNWHRLFQGLAQRMNSASAQEDV